ncbi:MAG: PAS domain-containing protein, partial [Demequina sp.]|uniref:PAS domain-containing protein n=1 Tax=Demequina sp. TaxID=2050685 RepID=UPI003A866213
MDQLFFSTTNKLGIIEQANSVFSQISRFSHEELVGKPHNLIRHPDMPQGAFRLMWDTLQAGEPFCAYVVNLAKDGSDYLVFATVTPLGDGYLSVRSRPCVTALRDA